MSIAEMYDPIADAPVLQFEDDGDNYNGNIIKYELQADKYVSGQIPAITLRLAEPTSDGDEYGKILARSKQLQRVIGRAAKRAGVTDDAIGDWLSVTMVEKRETSNGEIKWYEADNRLASPTESVDGDESIGTAALESDEAPF